MKPRARAAILLAFFAASAGSVWCQSVRPRAALKEERFFYQDVAGYHAQGRAVATDRAEAQRLAKAAALARLFGEIGKDTIFTEMCISGWPEYITVEDSITESSGDGYVALVQVAVATSAVMLTEQKYQVAVTELLNSAERAMAEVEKDLGEADSLERNVQVAEALGSYRRARTRAAEAREIVKDVGDKSVISETGNNIAAIAARLDALSLRVAGGLERMEAIEREAQKNAAADEMTKAYDLYEDELLDMEGQAEELLASSPFYDLARARLDAILLDLQAGREKNAQVMAELERLRSVVPEDRDYLRQKIELSLADARALALRLERMEAEVRQEIRLPRLVRQERTRRARAVLAAVGKGASYAFLHKPRDIVTFTWGLPLRWDMENPLEATGEADLLLEVDGVFPGGFWIRGALGHEDVTDLAGLDTWKSSAWSSGVDLGFGKRTTLGIGVSWDWQRTATDLGGGGAEEAERELSLRLDLGGLDTERRRVGWLLSLGYVVPSVPAGEILIPYHLNASLTGRFKVADILVLRGALRSKAYQSAAWEEGVAFADAFSYRFDWSLGLGLRLPPPFILALSYGGQITAGLEAGGLASPDSHAGAWDLSLGYVF